MLSQRTQEILSALAVLVIAGLLLAAQSQDSKPPYGPQTPEVQTEQKSAEGIGQKEDAKTTPPNQEKEHASEASGRAPNHAQEFTIGGVRVGEGALAIATFLLVWATWSLVRDAKHNAWRQLRAYVGPDHIDLECPNLTVADYVPVPPSPGQIITDFILISVKNFGATPASEVKTWTNWVAVTPFGGQLPADWPFADHQSTSTNLTTIEKRTLFPAQTFVSKIGVHDLTTFRQAVALTSSVYLYGHIDYRDVFGRDQVTEFCFVYNPWRGRDQFTAIDRHNRAT